MKTKNFPTKAKTKASQLEMAWRHLERVQVAADDPVDWTDLSVYGFYCLEAAVDAAALHFQMKTSQKHFEKVDLADELHQKNGLPDISELLVDLNAARKAETYGDIQRPEFDPQDVATEIERYVEAVAALVAGKPS